MPQGLLGAGRAGGPGVGGERAEGLVGGEDDVLTERSRCQVQVQEKGD